MKATFLVEKFESGMHFILLNQKIVTALTKNGNKRTICRLNDTLEFHCSIMPKKEGGHFINIGQKICKQLKIKVGSKVHADLTIDTTEYQFNMPEEFKEVLDTDPKASEIFHALTEGNQRGLIYLVSLVKSSEKKIERSLKIVEKMKQGITSPRKIL